MWGPGLKKMTYTEQKSKKKTQKYLKLKKNRQLKSKEVKIQTSKIHKEIKKSQQRPREKRNIRLTGSVTVLLVVWVASVVVGNVVGDKGVPVVAVLNWSNENTSKQKVMSTARAEPGFPTCYHPFLLL